VGGRTPRSPAASLPPVAFSGLLASTGLTPAQVREKVMADRPPQSAQVFTRAHERGEISSERVLAIVDDLFMPLVAANRPG
jgi:hypothetical protein